MRRRPHSILLFPILSGLSQSYCAQVIATTLENEKKKIVRKTICIHLVQIQTSENTHHQHYASGLGQRFLTPLIPQFTLFGWGTIVAMRVTTGCRYPSSLLMTSTISGCDIYPFCTLGYVVAISVILSSTTCSAWAAPLDAPMRLSGSTDEGFLGSNLTGHFLLSRRAEGPASKTSPCYGREARDLIEAGAKVGTDGRDIPTHDLWAGGGVSCFLKLDISKKKRTRVSSKAKILEIKYCRSRHLYPSQAEHQRAPPQLWLAIA